jgi:hypothetical protein
MFYRVVPKPSDGVGQLDDREDSTKEIGVIRRDRTESFLGAGNEKAMA